MKKTETSETEVEYFIHGQKGQIRKNVGDEETSFRN